MPFSGYGDLNGEFASRLQAFVAASGGRITITSGFRSIERQQQLWEAALAKYGDPEIADNWVARPGKSHHNLGIAADLGFTDPSARQWAHANAARFGLHFPMEWEPWHIEPTGSVEGADRGAYTTPPPGQAHPQDQPAEDPYDPGVQFGRLMGALIGGPDTAGVGSPSAEVVASPSAPQAMPEIEQQLTEAAGAGGVADGA